jgi:Uma2 family endonuclease
MTNAAPPKLLTAEEYAVLPDDGRRTELVKGVVVEMPQPGFRHGKICNRVGRIIGNYADEHDLGHVLNNDSGVVTRRGPDTVRGPDVSYYSFTRVPKDESPESYPSVPPELVFEVKSPSNRVIDMTNKANEYLTAGVLIVCILDPETESIGVFTSDELPRRYSNGDELTLPGVLPDFRVPVRQFFA